MLEVFSKHYIRDGDARTHTAFSIEPSLKDFIQLLGGSSFSRGLYRVILESEKHEWDLTASKAFPAFGNRLTCFAYDWLGRIFALDPGRLVDGLPGVVMLEPGTGDALEIPCHLSSFHDEELIEFRDAALAAEFYENWLSQGGPAPSYSQCIGYLRPLFLSGKDEVANLGVSDLDVYWEIASQLILKVRGIPTAAD
jgi:hypothetical protein